MAPSGRAFESPFSLSPPPRACTPPVVPTRARCQVVGFVVLALLAYGVVEYGPTAIKLYDAVEVISRELPSR